MDYDRLKILFYQYYRQELAPGDLEEFRGLVREAGDEYLNELSEQEWKQRSVEADFFTAQESTRMLVAILKNQEGKAPIRRLTWVRMVAAAVILFAIVGAILVFQNKAGKPPVMPVASKDVEAPSGNHATIQLSDGRTIFLDSVRNGQMAEQESIKIVKLEDGKLAYEKTKGSATQQLIYNTLTNPRGSKVVDITLADGSRVWLNAGSSITYPVAFVGNSREVRVEGEAYFEVMHIASRPFIVSKGTLSVEVLGTHFNVNAYDDEEAIRVTLLEGSVKVQKVPQGNSSPQIVIIKPGEQAVASTSIRVDKNVDLDEVMAWKNGEFQFGDRSDIETVMRQISRWYDVDIEYTGTLHGHIGGSISRSASVSSVLKMLEATGAMSYKIQGKKIILSPR